MTVVILEQERFQRVKGSFRAYRTKLAFSTWPRGESACPRMGFTPWIPPWAAFRTNWDTL